MKTSPRRRSADRPFRPGLVPTALVALSLTVTACSGGEAGGDWAGTELDSAGVHLVHNPDRGLWQEDETWTVEEELRLGTLEGPRELQFGQITALDVDGEGRIYIADSQAREVRVFDADGTHLRTLGSPGSGPGELGQSLTALFADDDGGVRVVDMMNQRVSAFASDGSPSGGFPLDMTGGIPLRWERLPSGQLVTQLRGMGMPGMDAHPGGDPLVVFSPEGEVVDTVHQLPRGESFELSGGGMPRIKMFEAEPLWDAGSGGILVTAMNSDYRVEVRDPDGSIRHVFTRPFEPRPVEPADERAFQRLLRQTMEDQGTPPQAVEMMMGNLSFAENYPAFGNLLAGPRGTIWLQRVITASDLRGEEDVEIDPQDLGSPDWDVFGPEGRFLGTVTLPRRFNPMRVQDDALYGVWTDDLDVQHIMRLRIRGTAPPAA